MSVWLQQVCVQMNSLFEVLGLSIDASNFANFKKCYSILELKKVEKK